MCVDNHMSGLAREDSEIQERTSDRICTPSGLTQLPLPPVGKGWGWTLKWQLHSFSAPLSSPFVHMHATQEKRKGIIRASEGAERPREMTCGTASSTAGQGGFNILKEVATWNLSMNWFDFSPQHEIQKRQRTLNSDLSFQQVTFKLLQTFLPIIAAASMIKTTM